MNKETYQVFFYPDQRPDQRPEDTLKPFEEFTQVFELRYEAQYPDPPPPPPPPRFPLILLLRDGNLQTEQTQTLNLNRT